MQKNKFFYILSFLFLLSLDQISKYIIRTKGGFYICNPNLAFNLNFNIVITIIFIIFLFFIAYNLKFKIINLKSISNYKFKISNWNTLPKITILLIASGAISNIIDRIYFGCVIDFIDLKFWPVFNFADIYITIGVVILLIRTTDYHTNSHDSTEF